MERQPRTRTWPVAAAALAVALVAPAPARAADRAGADEVYDVHPWLDGALVLAGTLGSAVPYALQSRLITLRCPCSPDEVNAFDRPVIGNHSDLADHLSDVSIGAIVAGPLLLDLGALGASRAFADDAVVYAEVLALNQVTVTAVKYLVQRPIPRTYAGDPAVLRSPDGYRAFYSGHASTAFAALSAGAVTASLRYGTGAWPWAVVGVLGTSVAVERVLAGRHFYTDVIVGAAAGTAFGVAVPLLHRRRRRAAEPRLSAAPLRGGFALRLSGAL